MHIFNTYYQYAMGVHITMTSLTSHILLQQQHLVWTSYTNKVDCWSMQKMDSEKAEDKSKSLPGEERKPTVPNKLKYSNLKSYCTSQAPDICYRSLTEQHPPQSTHCKNSGRGQFAFLELQSFKQGDVYYFQIKGWGFLLCLFLF